MNNQDYLLICLAEECAEVSQRATKALRFGIDEVQPGQQLNNRERLIQEIADLFAVVEELCLKIPREKIEDKKLKIAKYMAYSAKIGRLDDRTS